MDRDTRDPPVTQYWGLVRNGLASLGVNSHSCGPFCRANPYVYSGEEVAEEQVVLEGYSTGIENSVHFLYVPDELAIVKIM